MFSASSALEWASVVQEEAMFLETGFIQNGHQEHVESFSKYVILEGLGTSIAEDRLHGRLDESAVATYHEALVNWNESNRPTNEEYQSGQLYLLMLWHWLYMSLLVDFDSLERAIGRDGPEAAKTAAPYVSAWLSSPASTRCVLHALLPLRQLQSLRFDNVHALHVLRTLFCAAVAWYCYLQYGPSDDAVLLFDDLEGHFPELKLLGERERQHLEELRGCSWRHGDMSAVKAMTLCEIGESLQRISHWGTAREFAAIVAMLIYDDEQESMART
jgi:hypothetical protein